jgi:hypothetical protein
MFSKTVIDSDAFLDMPLSTQALYFHFAMRADDDGLINNARKIQRMLGASDDDCKLLVAKDYIICFDSGIVAVPMVATADPYFVKNGKNCTSPFIIGFNLL